MYLRIYWTDFHDFSPNGRFLFVDDQSGYLFFDSLRDVAMATNDLHSAGWRSKKACNMAVPIQKY